MGLKDLLWPFKTGDTEEDTLEEDAPGISEDPGTALETDSKKSVTDGFDAVGGVMDENEDGGSEQTLLGTDPSGSIEGNTDTEQDSAGSPAGLESREAEETGPSVADFPSDDIGEEPVEIEDDEEETDENEPEEDLKESGDGDEPGIDFDPDTFRSSTPENGRRHGENDDTFMELPQVCVTEQETPDPDASAEDMLPEALPGWDFQKTDRYRWQMDNALDYINATYRDPLERRYMFHVSKWKPRHVQYALDNLYGFGEPNSFDIWTARGQFVFAVKIAGGTVDSARTLMMAAPALSKSYFQAEEGSL